MTDQPAICGSCGAALVWARTVPAGKPMPIDRDSAGAADGAVLVFRVSYSGTDRSPIPGVWCVAVPKDTVPAVPNHAFTRYRTHFQTCPNADQHRKEHA